MANSEATVRSKTPPISELRVRAFQVPTETPEADGTLKWSDTTLVLVELRAGETVGLGFTYADASTAHFITTHFHELLINTHPFEIPQTHEQLVHAIRNLGRSGVASMAISAVDIALWDLKARLLDLPLAQLFGQAREDVPFYGSGGFTSYSIPQLQSQLKGWVDQGLKFVKMKIGARPHLDLARVRAAREVLGDVSLFVDANGAYTRKQALEFANEFYRIGVRWFEEPVSSDDLGGLHFIRERGPAGLVIAAGEYGYDLPYFKRMLDAGAVDVLQIDVTRCGGYTDFFKIAALAEAYATPISAHCAPTLHTPLGTALSNLQHVEYFFDHARTEERLFEGAIRPERGTGRPRLTSPGLGLRVREKEAAPYAIYSK